MPPSAWWAAPAMGASSVSMAFSLPSEMGCFDTLAAMYGQTPSGVKRRHHRPVGRRRGQHGRWSGERVKEKKAEVFRAYDRSYHTKKGHKFVPEKRHAHKRGKTFRLLWRKALRMFQYTVFPTICGERCVPLCGTLWCAKRCLSLL